MENSLCKKVYSSEELVKSDIVFFLVFSFTGIP